MAISMGRSPPVTDTRTRLEINGSAQPVRLCASRVGLPPVLIVQAGPGLPVLHEVSKFQRLLALERDFLVAYWEQRGCGNAPKHDALRVSWGQQVDDLRAVLRWLHDETKQPVTVLGISLGASIALTAVAREPHRAKAIVAISPDADAAASDASANAFLRARAEREEDGRLSAKLQKLGEPPYTEPAPFQLRARLLADLGGIEHTKTFNGVLKETLLGMLRTYGPVGTARALRNMNLVQRAMLPELASLTLLTDPPRVQCPVHYVFGAQDPLETPALITALPAAIAAPITTVVIAPDAGHMVHFDQPALVRDVVIGARDGA
jgi:pimeloyl-ACP methyl ester carboxylesterase